MVKLPTSSAVLLGSAVVHLVGELQSFMFSLQVDEDQAGGGQGGSSSVGNLDLQLPPRETGSHSPPQRNLSRLGVDVKQVFFIGQHEVYRPVLTLVFVSCRNRGNYLVWESPHGDPGIDGILVTHRHVVVHVLHLNGHRRHGAQRPLSAAVRGHGPEGVLSPALSVQSPGGADHSCGGVHRERPLAAVLCQRVGDVPVGPLVRVDGADSQDLSSDR